MSENVISQNDIAELRRTADKAKMTPGMFAQGERLHTLLDVYEGQEEVEEAHAKAIEDLEKERDDFKDDLESMKETLREIQKLAKNVPEADRLLRLSEISIAAGAALAD